GSLKPLSLSPMQQRSREFAAICSFVEREWQDHLRLIEKAKNDFHEKNRAYENLKNFDDLSESIILNRNQALIKWHDLIDMARESIYDDEREATQLFNTPGCDSDSEMAREIAIKMRKVTERRRELLKKLQSEVDQHTIFVFESQIESFESMSESPQSSWTAWFWKKLGPQQPKHLSTQPDASKLLPAMKKSPLSRG
ncbi:MAG: hypothetical protein ACYCQI_08375, partial [Gammaproteobacteria bacterium]